ncbi:uncharacterized protein LOC125568040 [Nematostella vectensis]|uniref:uncharacterized protein LOC125568040 n=1 Tax=Nematostella vectensis TaxID=45351 RepID=UPI002076F550|nr:uncharacterized protein LOC125568040 [Nematostella vectensis]
MVWVRCRLKERVRLVVLALFVSLQFADVKGAPLRQPRDLLQMLKDAGNAVKRAGEKVLRAILPKVMNSGLIPGTKTESQKTTQPNGPKIPLNTISEHSVNPVIPSKKNEIPGKSQSITDKTMLEKSFISALSKNSNLDSKKNTQAQSDDPNNLVAGLLSSVLGGKSTRTSTVTNGVNSSSKSAKTNDSVNPSSKSATGTENMVGGLINSVLNKKPANIETTLENEAVKEIEKGVQHFFYT